MNFKVLVISIFIMMQTGCMSNEYTNIKRIKVGDEVYLSEKGVLNEINTLENRFESKILILKERISNLEKRQNKTNENLVISKDIKWACIISPTFEEKRFIASSFNKTEAIFEVIEKCRQAGISDFYCNERDVKCSDQ